MQNHGLSFRIALAWTTGYCLSFLCSQKSFGQDVCLFDWSSNRWLFVFYFLGVTFRIFVQKNSSTGLFVCFSFLPFSSVYRELFVCHFLCVFDCHKRSNICFLSFFVCDFKNHCHKRSNSKHQADVNLRGKKPLSQVCFWHFLFIYCFYCL